jgi:AraC family L-rhamnose operon transcriptional activator RhaR/AraC family L-rhamnose operon regulatory protein RhaS
MDIIVHNMWGFLHKHVKKQHKFVNIMPGMIFSFDTRINDREFPLRVRRSVTQNPTAMHCHEFTELVIVYDGGGPHITGANRRTELSRGSVFVVPRGAFHQYPEGGISLLNIIYEADLFPLPLMDARMISGFEKIFRGHPGSMEIFKMPDKEFKEFLALAEKLESELNERAAGFQFAATGLFISLLACLARAAGGGESVRRLHRDVGRAAEYMRGHFTENVSVEVLAKKAGMSMSSLLRHFKRIHGVSPKRYLLTLKINHAAELLSGTDLSVSEAAFQSGFNDSNYFSREFRRLTGRPPLKYRKEMQARATAPPYKRSAPL